MDLNTVLEMVGFPPWPDGDPGRLHGGAHAFHAAADDIQSVFSDLQAEVGSIRWTGPAGDAMRQEWDRFTAPLAETIQHFHDFGDGVAHAGDQIQNLQDQWKWETAGIAAALVGGLVLSLVTAGLAEEAAIGAAEVAGRFIAGLIDAAESVIARALVAALEAAMRLAAKFAVRFTYNLVLNLGSQELGNGIARGDWSPADLNYGEAAFFAGGASLIPGLGGARGFALNAGANTALDAGYQYLSTGQVNPNEMGSTALLSGVMHGAGHLSEGGTRPEMTFDDLMSRYSDRLTDPSGRRITPADLQFSGASPQAVADALEGRNPIGTSAEQWAAMKSDLGSVISDTGLGPVEVGVAGSSTRFFAGSSKPFPTSVDDVRAQALKMDMNPDVAAARWNQSPYAGATDLPALHFFDSRYHLGIDARSDIDLSLYGPGVDQRMQQYLAAHPELSIDDVVSAKGGVYKTRHLTAAIPELGDFIDSWTRALDGREVNVVGKPYAGPGGRPASVWDLGDLRG